MTWLKRGQESPLAEKCYTALMQELEIDPDKKEYYEEQAEKEGLSLEQYIRALSEAAAQEQGEGLGGL